MIKFKRNFNFKIAFLFVFLAVFLFATISSVSADITVADTWGSGELQDEFAEKSKLGDEDPRTIIAKLINVALGFLGIIAVVLIIYAGWLWMSSAGNPEVIGRAKKVLTNAVIGLIIILAAFRPFKSKVTIV